MKLHPRLKARAASLLLIVLCGVLCGCKEVIVHDVSEQDANRVLSSLSAAGIEIEKTRQADGRWSLSVERDNAVKAIRYLDGSGVLGERAPSVDMPQFLGSRDEERHRYELALARELDRTLRDIPGVVSARTHVNLPPLDPIWGRVERAESGSASVLLVARDGASITKEHIIALVSGAAGIGVEHVTVVVTFKQVDPYTAALPGFSAESTLVGTLDPAALQMLACIIFGAGFILMLRELPRPLRKLRKRLHAHES